MKKTIALLLTLMTLITGTFGMDFTVNAEEVGEDIDYSYLVTDSALIGYTGNATKGIYLVEGHSVINKISTNKIGAGGITNASRKCSVSITSIVERQMSYGWVRVSSWSQSNENAFSAVISKSLIVGTGYNYRVRSTHYAESDVSSSCTSNLSM